MAENKIILPKKFTQENDMLVALTGNPNVGKSSLFNSLTGLGVLTANYAGKTVELNMGTLRSKDKKIGFVDLPGIYYLHTKSEDQALCVSALFEIDFDVIVYVIDSTNLTRNLYLLLQLIELNFPIVVALNFSDVAERKGLKTDVELLEKLLYIKVIPISAVRGDGIDKLVEEIIETKNKKTKRIHRYSNILETEITKLEEIIQNDNQTWSYHADKKGCASLLLEGNKYCNSLIDNEKIKNSLADIKKDISEKFHDENPDSIIIKERYGLAGSIASQVQQTTKKKRSISEKIWDLTTYPPTGLPILFIISALVILTLFQGGATLSAGMEQLWGKFCAPFITSAIHAVAGKGIWATILNWGFNDGLLAALSIGVPYVLIFYIILSLLEDTGYLNAAAFLVDKAMHFIGLNSRAFIPLSAAIGCSVPAVIGTRILNSKREKIIAIALIVLIACSARIAVIFGAVSKYLGLFWALSIIAINGLIVITAGYILNRMTEGEQEGEIIEVFPLRRPHMLTVLKKTWIRFADFIWIATPIVIVGSMVLGWLYETGYIWNLAKPLSPIFTGWLGLPSVAGIALFFAVLRKELALQFLVILASAQHGHQISSLTAIMTPEQIYVFTLFNTLYMPCMATIAVMGREIGWKYTTLILTSTLTFTIIFTGLVHRILLLFNLP